jgi:BolA protein
LALRGNIAARSEGMSIEAIIREKLTKAFAPTRLDVINESHLHAGHRGSPGTGESHFRVLVVSAEFAGASRVARHRAVNKLLDSELKGKVHALALQTFAPDEQIR